jgi:hypothetical protein
MWKESMNPTLKTILRFVDAPHLFLVFLTVSYARHSARSGHTSRARGKASKLTGVKSDNKEPFQARCDALLKKLGRENRAGDQGGCPVFVDFPDTTALILVSLFGGTSQKTSSMEPRPHGTSCRREMVTHRPFCLLIGT